MEPRLKPVALKKANYRLVSATQALERCRKANTYDEFAQHWYEFLSASVGLFNVLEKAARETPQARQWFFSINKVVRKDPLLQYMLQARNSDEHGINLGTTYKGESLAIGVNKPGYATMLEINSTPDGGLAFSSVEGKPIIVKHTSPTIQLIPVWHDQHPDTIFHPPTTHLGDKIKSQHPLHVAELYLRFLRDYIEDAKRVSDGKRSQLIAMKTSTTTVSNGVP